MGSFVNLNWLDPYELLAYKLRLSRHAMTVAFDHAVEAYLRCHEILDEVRAQSMKDGTPDWLSDFDYAEDNEPPYNARVRQYEAQVQDNLADWQASVVLLFADDALQTFARAILPQFDSLDGYGPEYPDSTNSGRPVKLTTLLRAGTNTIRHVSDWDTPEFPFPYKEVDDSEHRWKQPLRNIDVITRVFGLGKDGRIRDVVSMRVLIRVDGTLYPGTRPQYENFERAIIEAGRDIAKSIGSAATAKLEHQLAAIA